MNIIFYEYYEYFNPWIVRILLSMNTMNIIIYEYYEYIILSNYILPRKAKRQQLLLF